MTLKSYLLLSGGGGLLATYLFVSTPIPPPSGGTARQPAAARPPATVDIQHEAARLQTRVQPEIEYQAPSRNPFRFGSRPAPTREPSTPPRQPVEPPVEIPVDAPAPPPIRLSGVANDGGTRSAFLVTAQGVLVVREGGTVPPQCPPERRDGVPCYRVGRIEEDAIELVGPDGATRRLKLRP